MPKSLACENSYIYAKYCMKLRSQSDFRQYYILDVHCSYHVYLVNVGYNMKNWPATPVRVQSIMCRIKSKQNKQLSLSHVHSYSSSGILILLQASQLFLLFLSHIHFGRHMSP